MISFIALHAMCRLVGGSWVHQPHMETIREFFRVLAVCHTVVPDGIHRCHMPGFTLTLQSLDDCQTMHETCPSPDIHAACLPACQSVHVGHASNKALLY